MPFVILGCIISGSLQAFLTPERIKKILPKNKILSICVGGSLGLFFPSCECGIVPIVNQFIKKGVPSYTAFAFMLTAPIINPIVLFSTYIAFNNSLYYVFLRAFGSMFVALLIGLWLAYIHKDTILTQKLAVENFGNSTSCKIGIAKNEHKKVSFKQNLWSMLVHSLDEFFDTGRYLIIGSFLAALMQTYLPTAAIMQLGKTKFLAIVIMLIIAVTLSLCSEADAFIGSSLLGLFGTAPVIAFLVFGPMVDIKNLLMMKRYMKTSFTIKFVALAALFVSAYAYLI